MQYDYEEAVQNDVRDYLEEHYTKEELVENLADSHSRDRFAEELYDKLFCEDSVTGNASGSYTFSSWQAEENLCHNMDLLCEALNEFGCDSGYIEQNGAESCDVTIRCHLLPRSIESVLSDLEDELEEEIEKYFYSDEEDEETKEDKEE